MRARIYLSCTCVPVTRTRRVRAWLNMCSCRLRSGRKFPSTTTAINSARSKAPLSVCPHRFSSFVDVRYFFAIVCDPSVVSGNFVLPHCLSHDHAARSRQGYNTSPSRRSLIVIAPLFRCHRPASLRARQTPLFMRFGSSDSWFWHISMFLLITTSLLSRYELSPRTCVCSEPE